MPCRLAPGALVATATAVPSVCPYSAARTAPYRYGAAPQRPHPLVNIMTIAKNAGFYIGLPLHRFTQIFRLIFDPH